MPEITLKTPSSEPQSVRRLADKIQAVLTKARAQAQAAVGKIGTRAYWQVGKFIQQDILRRKNRADYGASLIPRLAQTSGLRERLLYDCLSFYKKYPILPSRAELTWSHYRNLLAIENSSQRLALESLSEKSNWPSSRLQEEVQKIRQSPRPLSRVSSSSPRVSRPLPPFKPRHGKLHTWLVRLPIKNAKQPELDLGFYTFRGLTSEELKRFPEGSIVTLEKGRLVKSESAKNELYTYEAELERVVDGDTVWMKIDLGFGISARKKLRLRGIDCPERETPEGKRAKKFVEGFFSAPLEKAPEGQARFTVTTTKPDKYDRYLSDIWHGGKNLNALLLEHKHARLKTSYTHSDWTESA